MSKEYIHTSSLTIPMYQIPYWEACTRSAGQEIPAFYGNRRFINVFTRTRHWIISWISWLQTIPKSPISLRSILIVSSHIRLGLVKWSSHPVKIFRLMFCMHSSSLPCLLHVPPFSPSIGPAFTSIAPFSLSYDQIFSSVPVLRLCSSLNVRVLHPYIRTDKIVGLNVF
jgi:hypothetical protein